MAITISGTNGIVGAGFTVDNSGVSVTAGVGTFASIGAGVSVSAAGLTGALPTISAANCTNLPAANLTGTLPAISGANLTGISAGITMHDNWYIGASLSPGDGEAFITANWTRDTSTEVGSIGSAMTESSGVFTFPSTGIYKIVFNGGYYVGDSASKRYVGFAIHTTLNNSGYSKRNETYQSVPAIANNYVMCPVSYVFDVTDTSNCKIKFSTIADGTGGTIIDISGKYGQIYFTRLGDT